MWIERQLRRWRNPHNLTRLHHAAEAVRHGYEIGDYSYGRLQIRSWGEGAKLTIGRYCSFADGVTVFLGGNHRTDWVSTYPFSDFPELWPEARGQVSTLSTRGDVRIGSDVWVGAGATILSGVSIAHGAVIGARAVVAKDVPPYAVLGGNPATVLKLRFDEATVASLLDLAWWDLERDAVARLAPLLQGSDAQALIAETRRLRAERSGC
jgi:acetyltransferase-like isoleucine patch superfamily enzyme